MRLPITVKQGMEKLCSHSGLNLIGLLLSQTRLKERLEQLADIHCVDPLYRNFEILSAMLGLICIGKPTYDAIEIFRTNPDFFNRALNLSGCPSTEILRQRIDLIGSAADTIIKEESAALVRRAAPFVSPIETSAGRFVPLDMDVSPFDNSKTRKEGVSRTYKGCDGYAPMFAYCGTEGYLINLELRKGSQHCQSGTPEFIEKTLTLARALTSAPLLVRLDSGNDSRDNFPDPEKFPGVEFIVKRNLRRESKSGWLRLARERGRLVASNERKNVWIGKTGVGVDGSELPFPICFEVTERFIHKNQRLLIPEIEVDSWWFSIAELEPEEVVALYRDHGTSEQFHSEIKSDMDMERLPSGKFGSNSLILHLAMLAYNMLRIIGQQWIEEDKTSTVPRPRTRRQKVRRRRIRTVMQDIVYMAGRLVRTSRKVFISFGQLNPFADLQERIENRIFFSTAIE